MQTKSVPLNFKGRQIPFEFPVGGNIMDHIQEILGGKTYPVSLLPQGYRNDVIVDAGANVGASALWFLGAAPDARIVCFEPAAHNYRCLSRNLASFPRAET